MKKLKSESEREAVLLEEVALRYEVHIDGLEFWSRRIEQIVSELHAGSLSGRLPPAMALARIEMFADAAVALTTVVQGCCTELLAPPRQMATRLLFAFNATERRLRVALGREAEEDALAELADCLSYLATGRAELLRLVRFNDSAGGVLADDAESLVGGADAAESFQSCDGSE